MDMQIDHEACRLDVIARLEDARKREAEYCRKRYALEAEIREKKAELARHLETFNSITVEHLEAQLRKLADPAIAGAITETVNLAIKAREAYRSTNALDWRGIGPRRLHTVSNALEITEIMARIQAARLELEAMLTAPRPDDLDALIKAKLSPLREAVGNLYGL